MMNAATPPPTAPPIIAPLPAFPAPCDAFPVDVGISRVAVLEDATEYTRPK
jgi:hypothetical protein